MAHHSNVIQLAEVRSERVADMAVARGRPIVKVEVYRVIWRVPPTVPNPHPYYLALILNHPKYKHPRPLSQQWISKMSAKRKVLETQGDEKEVYYKFSYYTDELRIIDHYEELLAG